jgi:hypothetical protein
MHNLLVLGEEHDLSKARIVVCGDYMLFQGPKPNPDVNTVRIEQTVKLWNWKSGELLVRSTMMTKQC